MDPSPENRFVARVGGKSLVQHLRQRALGQQAWTDLQNLGTCYISLSCRALSLILRNARNGGLEFMRRAAQSEFLWGGIVSADPCRVHRSKPTNYNRAHFSATRSHSTVSNWAAVVGLNLSGVPLRPPQQKLIATLQPTETGFDPNTTLGRRLLFTIVLVSCVDLIGSI